MNRIGEGRTKQIPGKLPILREEEKVKEKVKVKWSVMSVTVVLFIIMLGAILINAEKFYDILYNLVIEQCDVGTGLVLQSGVPGHGHILYCCNGHSSGKG